MRPESGNPGILRDGTKSERDIFIADAVVRRLRSCRSPGASDQVQAADRCRRCRRVYRSLPMRVQAAQWWGEESSWGVPFVRIRARAACRTDSATPFLSPSYAL